MVNQRRKIKEEAPTWQAAGHSAELARQAVLAAELEAERVVQGLAINALTPWPPEAGPAPRLAHANLLAYRGESAVAVAGINELLVLIG